MTIKEHLRLFLTGKIIFLNQSYKQLILLTYLLKILVMFTIN